MNVENRSSVDLFKERKETLFNSFKAIYEKIISKVDYLNSLSPLQINQYVESTVKNILISEREQFIFYITHIIIGIANSTNMEYPEFVSKIQEDIQSFNKKYDNEGQLSKILSKYFSDEYQSTNANVLKLIEKNKSKYDTKFKYIPKIPSFYSHLLGFSYEALLMRSMLFDIRTIIVTSQNSFSLFIKKAKQKLNEYSQNQKKIKVVKQNDIENELILQEREKTNAIKKNYQIICDENEKFRLKVEGEIIEIVKLINSLNNNQESNNYQITFDELNKQSKKLIKILKNDSILSKDFLNNNKTDQEGINSKEKYNGIENAEKLQLNKQLKEKNDIILNLRSQLNDLKIELLRSSLNKSNSVLKDEESSQKEIRNIEYLMQRSVSSKKSNSDLLNNDSDLNMNDLNNSIELSSKKYRQSSKSSVVDRYLKNEVDVEYKSDNESSIIANDNYSFHSYNQKRDNKNCQPLSSLNNHKHEIEELKKQLKHSKYLIDQLTDQNKLKDKAIAKLSQKLQDSSSRYDVLFDKINILKKKNKMLQKAKSNNDNNMGIDDSSSSSFVYCCTRENLLVEQISDKTNELIFKDTIIIELENENRKLQAQLELMKENHSISSRQVSRLKDDIQHIQNCSLNDLNELSKQLNENQILIREQADKISEYQQIKDKSEKYQKLKIKNKKLADQNQALIDDINKSKIEVQRVFEINKMKNENLKNKYTILKEKYEKKKEINDDLEQQNKKLIEEIKNLQMLKNENASTYHSEASSSINQSFTD